MSHPAVPASAAVALSLLGLASIGWAPALAADNPKSAVVSRCVSEGLREKISRQFPTEKALEADYYRDVVRAMICITKTSEFSAKSEDRIGLDLNSPAGGERHRRPSERGSGPHEIVLRKDTDMVGIAGSVHIAGDFKGTCTWTYFFAASFDSYRGLLSCRNDQDGTVKHVSDEFAKEWLDANVFASVEGTLEAMMRVHEKEQ